MAPPVPHARADDDSGGAAAASAWLCVAILSVFPETDDEDLELDRWRTISIFISAFLAEPALSVFNGCDMLDVEVFARCLIAGLPSEVWLYYLDCMQNVVFVWQVLLLVSDQLHASPLLSRAVGELLLFACRTDAKGLALWEAKAGNDAKQFRDDWADTSVEKVDAWLASQGIRDAATHVFAVGQSAVRVE